MANDLISVDEARLRVDAFMSPVSRIERVPLRLAAGRILARSVSAQIENPRFDQSAMDGYAIRLQDVKAGTTRLRLGGRIIAGSEARLGQQGEAIRIFTGAPLPSGYDAVIMQEHVSIDGEFIHFNRPVKIGDNIRRRGEDIACGAVLLTKGQRLDARHVAILAGQGYGEIDVFGRVRVAVISTGNELRQMGQALDDTAIYDSNRETIMALAEAAGTDVIDGGSLRDDPAVIAKRLSELIGKADLIVTTGGASVGDEDHCSEAFRRCGGRLENLRIAMKPGKPAIVGRCGSSVYLGLPGNPIAAIVVWWLLGETMVKRAQGFQLASQAFQVLPSRTSFPHKAGRTEFLPARVVPSQAGNTVEIIGRGGSARLLPLIQAHGFVEIPAEQAEISIGDGLRFRAFFGDLTV